MTERAARSRVASWIYLAALLPCAMTAAIGVYLVAELFQNGIPDREYGGLAPYLIAFYFGPGTLGAAAALLLGTTPGLWRLVLTAIAAVWSLTLAPMIWLGVSG